MQNKYQKPTGYVTLISMLVMGAVSLSAVLSIFLTGVITTKESLAVMQSSEANALALACAEDGLEAIRDDNNYTGNTQINLGNGTCTYTVTSSGGESRTIASSGTVGTIIRKIKIQIDVINPQINIASWQEVADF